MMNIKEKVKSHPSAVDYFKKLRFYNKNIEKPKFNAQKTLIYFLNFPFMKN